MRSERLVVLEESVGEGRKEEGGWVGDVVKPGGLKVSDMDWEWGWGESGTL